MPRSPVRPGASTPFSRGPAPAPLAALENADSEIVIGVVSAVGTDQDAFQRLLERLLPRYGYAPRLVRLSEFLLNELRPRGRSIPREPEIQRVTSLMDAGTRARKEAARGDLLALYAIAQIHRKRQRRDPRLYRTAHVLRTLKHPDEVRTLRRVYGPGFVLIGLYATEEDRLSHLVNEKDVPRSAARALLARDQDEGDDLGQQTRRTFALSDAFVRMGGDGEIEKDVSRFLDLLFGFPYATPTQDEYSMFLAFSAALRSGDLSRQVGAVVTTSRGDVVASGANDDPAAGGGLYWPGPGDQRDHGKTVQWDPSRRSPGLRC